MPKKPFGQLLREECKRRHWSQETLGEKVGVDLRTVSRWVKGDTIPSPALQAKLQEVLGKDLLSEIDLGRALLDAHFPPRNEFFSGRADIMQRIQEQFIAGKTMVALGALGGMGKTQIVIEYAYRFQEVYQFILWMRADSRSTLALDCARLARILKLPERQPSQEDCDVDALKDWLHTHRDWLLILDNVEDWSIVEEFQPRLSQGHVLITTQASTIFEPTLLVQPMAQAEALSFLFSRAGIDSQQEDTSTISPDERNAAEQLLQQMDGLPLAIDQAAAYIRTSQLTVAHYFRLYQIRRKELLSIRGQPSAGHNASLVTTISLSLDKVRDVQNAVDLLEFCAFLYPDQIPEELLQEGLFPSLPADSARFHLIEAQRALLLYSLIARNAKMETLSMHRLVQDIIREIMVNARRDYWTSCAIRVLHALFSQMDIYNWLQYKRYIIHAQHCAAWIQQSQMVSEEAAQLFIAIGNYLQEQAQHTEAEAMYRQALAMYTYIPEQAQAATAEITYNLAVLYMNQGKYEVSEAKFEQAISLMKIVYAPNHPTLIMAFHTLGELYYSQARYQEAEQLFLSALSARETIYEKGHPLIATTYHCLALNYAAQQEDELAESFFQKALKIREQIFGLDHVYVAESLHDLAVLYEKQGFYEKAGVLLDKVLTIRKKNFGEVHPLVVESLQESAKLYAAQEKYEQAEELLQQVLLFRQQQPDKEHPDVADTLFNLGIVHRAQHHAKEAEKFLRQALRIREKTLDATHINRVISYVALGRFYMEQERQNEADWYFLQAFTILEERIKTEKSFRKIELYRFLLEVLGLNDNI